MAVLKQYLLLKRFFFWKSSSSQELPTSKKYMFWKIANSEEVAPPKHNGSCAGKILIFMNKPFRLNICYYEVVIRKKYLLQTTRSSEQKTFLRKSSCFKWLLSFQYNRWCSENIASPIRSLFRWLVFWNTLKESAVAKKNIECRWKNGWLFVFFRNNYSTSERKHNWNQLFWK